MASSASSSTLPPARPMDERNGCDPETFVREVAPRDRPLVIRGLVADWPAVAAARAGSRAMAEYLLRHDQGAPVNVLVGPPEIGGRYFYNDDMNGFNFTTERVAFKTFIGALLKLAEEDQAPALYAGSASATPLLPDWLAQNPLPVPAEGATPRLWIGNTSRVATHFDTSANIACVVAGRRRFTLFPPEQIANLYIGPLDVTMAGQPASMVDVANPDLQRYPRYAEAWEHALVADLEPGDAIVMPNLWWHNVAADGTFNVMVNYWWGQASNARPFAALVQAIMSLRDLPAAERAAWRRWFDHYVFDDEAPQVADHLPEPARGILGPPTPERDRRVREYLMRVLTHS